MYDAIKMVKINVGDKNYKNVYEEDDERYKMIKQRDSIVNLKVANNHIEIKEFFHNILQVISQGNLHTNNAILNLYSKVHLKIIYYFIKTNDNSNVHMKVVTKLSILSLA